jgi:hypothetical protein
MNLKIEDIASDIKSDFMSCIYHAHDLLINSSTRRITIFFIIVLAFFVSQIINSHNAVEFYVNFFQGILFGISVYFVFCFSDFFWFLLKRKTCYKISIKSRRNINILLKEIKRKDAVLEDEDFEKTISAEVSLICNEYKRHATRYVIEILSITILMSYVSADFYFFTFIIFGGMFFLIFLNERQPADQAFDSISLLIQNLRQFNKLHPKKCKKFIMENNVEEIRKLKFLYKIIVKSQ